MSAKLDSGKAWTEATSMIGANRELVLVLAGVFFFVPLMILLLNLFSVDLDFGPAGAEPNPELISKQINAIITQYWWAILLVAVSQLAGAIALLGLLGDPKKPTVGEVVGMIPKLILTVIAAQIISTLASQALPAMADTLPPAVGSIPSILALIAAVYIAVKFSLTSAVITVEQQINPLKALKRSWELTSGNGWQIFVFFFLLTVTAIVLAIVIGLSFGLVFSLLGERFELIGNAVVFSALVAAFYALAYAVTAAIHRQLAGPDKRDVANTFN